MFFYNGYRRFLIVTLFVMAMLMTACGGDSSSPSIPTWVDDAVSAPAKIILPVDAPVDIATLEVAVMDREFFPDSLGNLNIKTPVNTPSDAYIMLPPKAGGDAPVIYLFATCFPGEANVEISVESTAIGLVMSSIPRHYLDNAGSPAQVKDTVILHAEPFITKFSTMIADDPYVLEYDNLPNVFDQTYKDSVSATYEALKLLMQTNAAVPARLNTAAKLFSVDEFGGQFIVTPAAEQDGFKIVAEFINGEMTGDLLVQNDTRLYAHTRVTTVLNTVIKDFPKGFVNSAFSPQILGSQAGFWGGFISTEERVKAGFKNVTVDIETAGTLDIGPDYYNTSGRV